MTMRILGRRTWRIASIAAAIFVVAALVLPAFIRRLIRTRLQSMIAAQLNADLQIGGLSYSFPYGVDLTDATLITHISQSGDLELLRVGHLGLRLARSPLRSGPLVVESLMIDAPSIHLIRDKTGIIGRRGLTREAAPPQAVSGSSPASKLSQMFQLRRLILHGGQVIYEDRTHPAAQPLVWKNLNVNLDTDPRSGSQYAFHFVADDAPLAQLDAAGAADIDSLVLELSRCTLAVSVDPSQKQSALPPEYQESLSALALRGGLKLSTTATLPLTDLGHSRYDTTLEIGPASARLPQWPTPLDHLAASVRCTNGAGRPELRLTSLDIASGGDAAHLAGGLIELGPRTLNWVLSGLTGRIDLSSGTASPARGSLEMSLSGSGPASARDLRRINAEFHLVPHNLAVKVPQLAQPLDQFTEAAVVLRDGVVSVQRLRAAFGTDLWYVRQATIDVTDLPRAIAVRDAQGAITFGTPRATYPPLVEKQLTQVQPAGPWFFEATGQLPLSDHVRPDYHVLIHTDRGRLTVSDYHIPLYNVHTQIAADPAAVQIQQFEAGTLRGNVRLDGRVDLVNQTRYDLNAVLRGVDLRELGRLTATPGSKATPLSGVGNLTLHAVGPIPKDKSPLLDSATADGELEVRHGDFWRIPVMKSIADSANIRSALTVGEAAAVFSVNRGTVHLRRAAASAPLLGVEGSGAFDFKGNLNLNVIATPLGQWSDKLDLGDRGIVNHLLGTIQQGVNLATSQALYQIHVGGTVAHPDARPVPVPFLSRQTFQLFSFLKSNAGNSGLLDFLKQQPQSNGNK